MPTVITLQTEARSPTNSTPHPLDATPTTTLEQTPTAKISETLTLNIYTRITDKFEAIDSLPEPKTLTSLSPQKLKNTKLRAQAMQANLKSLERQRDEAIAQAIKAIKNDETYSGPENLTPKNILTTLEILYHYMPVESQDSSKLVYKDPDDRNSLSTRQKIWFQLYDLFNILATKPEVIKFEEFRELYQEYVSSKVSEADQQLQEDYKSYIRKHQPSKSHEIESEQDSSAVFEASVYTLYCLMKTDSYRKEHQMNLMEAFYDLIKKHYSYKTFSSSKTQKIEKIRKRIEEIEQERKKRKKKAQVKTTQRKGKQRIEKGLSRPNYYGTQKNPDLHLEVGGNTSTIELHTNQQGEEYIEKKYPHGSNAIQEYRAVRQLQKQKSSLVPNIPPARIEHRGINWQVHEPVIRGFPAKVLVNNHLKPYLEKLPNGQKLEIQLKQPWLQEFWGTPTTKIDKANALTTFWYLDYGMFIGALSQGVANPDQKIGINDANTRFSLTQEDETLKVDAKMLDFDAAFTYPPTKDWQKALEKARQMRCSELGECTDQARFRMLEDIGFYFSSTGIVYYQLTTSSGKHENISTPAHVGDLHDDIEKMLFDIKMENSSIPVAESVKELSPETAILALSIVSGTTFYNQFKIVLSINPAGYKQTILTHIKDQYQQEIYNRFITEQEEKAEKAYQKWLKKSIELFTQYITGQITDPQEILNHTTNLPKIITDALYHAEMRRFISEQMRMNGV